MLLVAIFCQYRMMQNRKKWLKPWQMGTHLRVLSESDPIYTNTSHMKSWTKKKTWHMHNNFVKKWKWNFRTWNLLKRHQTYLTPGIYCGRSSRPKSAWGPGNQSSAETFALNWNIAIRPKYRDERFLKHLNPVMLVFIGKLSSNTLRWVPSCQVSVIFQLFLHHFVFGKISHQYTGKNWRARTSLLFQRARNGSAQNLLRACYNGLIMTGPSRVFKL